MSVSVFNFMSFCRPFWGGKILEVEKSHHIWQFKDTHNEHK
jgi:hypothetical protein